MDCNEGYSEGRADCRDVLLGAAVIIFAHGVVTGRFSRSR